MKYIFGIILFMNLTLGAGLTNVEFYLLHGVDKARNKFMQRQFAKYLPEVRKRIHWVNHPNLHELTKEHLSLCISDFPMPKGTKSCAIKHYLIIKEIVEKKIPLAVIMEDNICFRKGFCIELIEKYLKELPKNWDVLFEGDICNFHHRGPLTPGQLVYKRQNMSTEVKPDSANEEDCLARGCNFYIINLAAAKKLLKVFLPITHSPDCHYNMLFRKLQMNIYWAEPSLVHKIDWPNRTSHYN